jgi:hypothetical protein
MLAAPRRRRLAFQYGDLADAMCLFVQSGLPSLLALEFLKQRGLVSGQLRILTLQVCSFAKHLDWSAARRQVLPPFASAQAWALQLKISCVIWI